MKITGKLSSFDLFLLGQAWDRGDLIEAKVGASYLTGTETVKVHSDGFGEWYLFGGHCMWWGLVQAQSLQDAYEMYLEEFVTPDDLEEGDDETLGTFDSSGNWYSEATTSYITKLSIGSYNEWDITIKPREN